MKFEPRENRKPEAPLHGKQGAHSPPGHWMLKYEESIGGGAVRPPEHLVYSYRAGGLGPIRISGPLTFAAIYYTSGHLP